MSREKILQIINEKLPYLAATFNVHKIGLFGSVARGENRDESDIDLLVEFKDPIGLFDFIRLELFLSNALGRKVDLVSLRAIKPAIKQEILKDLIYA